MFFPKVAIRVLVLLNKTIIIKFIKWISRNQMEKCTLIKEAVHKILNNIIRAKIWFITLLKNCKTKYFALYTFINRYLKYQGYEKAQNHYV